MAKSKFYYKVTQFMTTLEKYPNKSQSFSHEEIFNCGNPIEDRKNAIAFYVEMYRNFNDGKASYIRPFAGPKNYEFGKHAAFSITLYMVDCWDEEETQYALAGEGEEESIEAFEAEEVAFQEIGIHPDPRDTALLKLHMK